MLMGRKKFPPLQSSTGRDWHKIAVVLEVDDLKDLAVR